ncbi:DUF4190 domain-containing protein (plasmid) [Pseudarthrobacter sp. P1]|uniref:DUF4190 domain-containing protein n=1 Tax=Pseudarthrobacter sp. P1 TaxID=3418418 RepID=UPI003CF674A8
MSTAKAPLATGRINKLAIAAVVLAAIAASGIWFFGVGVLAVFAVGAGHVSLNQIKLKNEKGRTLAIVALVLGYGLATWALFNTLSYIPAALQQTAA